MAKFKRNERIGAIIKILNDNPNKVFTLNYFTDIFNAAKSTISEDIFIIKELMIRLDFGKVQTIAGASGGVKYIPTISEKDLMDLLSSICNKLNDKSRIIPGSFLFMSDIIYNPNYVRKMGQIFAYKYIDKEIDYVVTAETKGIPLAFMTANFLNVPLVITRSDNKVTEGATVSMNYVSGSTGKIQTMYVSKRSIKLGAKVLIIDDFMKAGGTAKGMVDLMKEFDAKPQGIGVMIATKEPEEKLVDEYVPLIILDKSNREDGINLIPNLNILKK